jgi:proline iminopeptidase
MPKLAANGIELDYELHGDPAATPLLLIMGLGMPAAMWPAEFVDAFVARGYRVLTFDNRDSGGSTRLAGTRIPSVPAAIARALLRRRVHAPYTLDDMAADTAQLLDGLGIERAHVVGVSMGGMIAQVLAARYPQRVLTLTSIMSSTGNPQRKIAFGTRRALGAILRTPPPASDIPATVAHLERLFDVIGSPGFPQDRTLLQQHFAQVAQRGLYREGTARQMLAILGSGDRRELLRAITAPTYVIHGGDDPLVPLAAGIDTARCIAGARLEIVMGMGHDFPPQLMTSIAARIDAHCRAAAAPAGVGG